MSEKLRSMRNLAFAAGFGLLAVWFASPAQAEVSYKGKTIHIIINSTAGGGTDIAARLLGTALGKNLPGDPSVIFRNLPGGGGIQANNYFYSQVPPDGLTLLSGSRTQLSPTKLRLAAVKYNPAEYRFVGGTQRLGTVILVNKEQAARLNNPAAPPLVYGDVDGERSGLVAGMMWGKEFLGWNVRFVLGYSGMAALELAARRGEIDIVAFSVMSQLQPLMDNGMVPITQFGAWGDNDQRVARAAFPGVPLFDDMILPKLSGRALKAYEGSRDDQLVDKWLALPPKTPDAIVDTYRAAYMRAASDPKVMEINRRTYGEDVLPYSGEALDKITRALVATDEADLEFVIELKKKHGLPVN